MMRPRLVAAPTALDCPLLFAVRVPVGGAFDLFAGRGDFHFELLPLLPDAFEQAAHLRGKVLLGVLEDPG